MLTKRSPDFFFAYPVTTALNAVKQLQLNRYLNKCLNFNNGNELELTKVCHLQFCKESYAHRQYA
jgi:hypothetical protein